MHTAINNVLAAIINSILVQQLLHGVLLLQQVYAGLVSLQLILFGKTFEKGF